MTTKTWARLIDGVVAELVTLDDALVPGQDVPAMWSDDVSNIKGIGVGWIKGSKGTFGAPPAPPAPPVSVPQTISRRQFFQQLALQSVITKDEALAAVQTGAIPAEMAPLITALPVEQQFGAEMMVSGAADFDRNDPLTLELGEAKGWSSEQLDDLWIAAAAL